MTLLRVAGACLLVGLIIAAGGWCYVAVTAVYQEEE